MATNKLQFKRTTTDKLTVKAGTLSKNCEVITYLDEDNDKKEVKIADLLKPFKNQTIDLSIALKTDEDLDVISEDEE